MTTMLGHLALLALTQVDTARAGEAADVSPIPGWQGQLAFYAFLVVMLLVPAIMAWTSSDKDAPTAGPGDAGKTSGSRFTSDRERRLWLWTVIALVAIYSTLGPMEHLAAALRERNLLRVTSSAVLLLVVAVMVVPWAKKRPGPLEIGAAIGVAAVYLTTLIRLPFPEARSHLFEYGLVAVLIYHALTERRRNGRHIPVPALVAVVATVLVGWLDEAIQLFLPNRVYDLVDVGFNAIAAAMAVIATVFIGWARKLDFFRRVARRARELGGRESGS